MRNLYLVLALLLISFSSFAVVGPITGINFMCSGSNTTLSDTSSGGTWSSSNSSIATVGSTTGIVTGVSSGIATITYTVGGSYVILPVSVNPLPTMSGPGSLCNGSSGLISVSPSGGNWYSSAPAIISVGIGGVATALSSGSSIIKYTLPTGCYSTTVISVSPVDPIYGPNAVCVGSSILEYGEGSFTGIWVALSLGTYIGGGGTWSISPTTIATIDAGGTITGVSAGVATLSYLGSSGCVSTKTVTVNPATCSGTPYAGTAIANTASVCTGSPVSLHLYGETTGCSILYQWQQSIDGTTFTDISGANDSTYSETPTSNKYYRCKATCATTGLYSYSIAVHVSVTINIAAYAVIDPADTLCDAQDFYISTCGVSSTFNVTTFFGDGTSTNIPLTTSGLCYANVYHSYNSPGTYSIKQVLYNSTTALDSVTFSYEQNYCKTFPVKLFYDSNNNCLFDSGENYLQHPVTIEVDSASIPIDTISATSGFYYKALGPAGTIYSFKIVALLDGIYVSCPLSGILYDTVLSTVNNYTAKYMGFNCVSGGSYDLAVYATEQTGTHEQQGTIVVANSNCVPVHAMLTMYFSPRFYYNVANPPPVSFPGHSINWDLGVMDNNTPPITLTYRTDVLGTHLTPGDTVMTQYIITPITGDADTLNNVVTNIDTANGAYDPNEMQVSPAGNILPCTTLQYAISFENTGNDTAHNISVLDTLSDNLDPHSLRIITASGNMNIAIIKDGGYNVAKFDFPKINLLDSAHFGQCNGMLLFSIKTKSGLATGTQLKNYAGIFFDDNPAVLTDTTTNTIGINPITGTDNVCAGSSISLANTQTAGNWSSSNPIVATIGTAGEVSGIAAGSTNISYTISNSCGSLSAVKTITINPLPFAGVISSPSSLCVAANAIVADTVSGGSWLITNSHASLSGTTLTGAVAGVDTIKYVAVNSCGSDTASHTITIAPLPDAGVVSGATTVCVNATTLLTSTATGGVWLAQNSNATIAGGLITGTTAGPETILYIAANSCGVDTAIKTITIAPLPYAGIISGPASLCVATNTTFFATTTGGLWQSRNSNATVAGGIATGVTAGIDTVVYMVTNSCGTDTATKNITILPLPHAGIITGTDAVCVADTIVLLDTTTGGIWTRTNNNSAVTGGIITGTVAGIDTIMYLVTTSCGTDTATKIIHITPLPTPLVGTDNICVHGTETFSAHIAGGTWSSSNANAAVSPMTGLLTANFPGTTVLTYALPTGCTATATITINPLPTPYPVTGGGTFCNTDSGVHVMLASSTRGIQYRLYQDAFAVGASVAGTGTVLDLGLQATPGTYTVRAQNPATTCANKMTDSVVITSEPALMPFVTILSTHMLHLAQGQADTLIASVSGAGTPHTYQWTVNHTYMAGATNSNYVSTFNNNDSVTCIITTSNVCGEVITAYTVAMHVQNVGVPSFQKGESISIHPNPNKGTFTIQGVLNNTADDAVVLEVTDMLGQVVYTRSTTTVSGKLNETIVLNRALADGIYLLTIHTNGFNTTLRFTLEQ